MEIRKVKISDIDNGLLELFIEGYRYHYNGRPDRFTNRTNETLKEVLKELLDKEEFLIIEDNDKLIGYAAYEIKEKNEKRKLWVDELIIGENYRKQGYVRKLMDEIENIAKEKDCSTIEFSCWEFNKNAKEVYEHLGYKVQRVIYEKDI